MFDLTGRKALVTGATGGLGGSIARALHAQGAAVSISGTRSEALDALAAELGGERVHSLVTNLSDKDAVEALVPAGPADRTLQGVRTQRRGVEPEPSDVRAPGAQAPPGDRAQPGSCGGCWLT